MPTITISSKFQIVIPKAIRELLGLRPGQKFQAILANSVMLATARAFRATFWTQDADFDRREGVRFVSR
jgi:AbrB family looped-hinge helix DNA binding protein